MGGVDGGMGTWTYGMGMAESDERRSTTYFPLSKVRARGESFSLLTAGRWDDGPAPGITYCRVRHHGKRGRACVCSTGLCGEQPWPAGLAGLSFT